MVERQSFVAIGNATPTTVSVYFHVISENNTTEGGNVAYVLSLLASSRAY